MIGKKEFREDLYYRLNVIPFYIPPLRERCEDILPLIEHFIEKYNCKLGKHIRGISPQTLARLEKYGWPGNVRELENCIEYMVNFEMEDLLSEKNLPQRLRGEGENAPVGAAPAGPAMAAAAAPHMGGHASQGAAAAVMRLAFSGLRTSGMGDGRIFSRSARSVVSLESASLPITESLRSLVCHNGPPDWKQWNLVLKNGKFFVFENGFSLLFLFLRKFRRKCGETAAFFVGTIIAYYSAQADLSGICGLRSATLKEGGACEGKSAREGVAAVRPILTSRFCCLTPKIFKKESA